MTEHTPEKVTALIASARKTANRIRNVIGPSDRYADMIDSLADALEAAHMHVETIGDFLQAEIAESDRMESECVEHRAQHAEWVAKAEAERDEALAALEAVTAERDGLRIELTQANAIIAGEFYTIPMNVGDALARTSRIPEHPKED